MAYSLRLLYLLFLLLLRQFLDCGEYSSNLKVGVNDAPQYISKIYRRFAPIYLQHLCCLCLWGEPQPSGLHEQAALMLTPYSARHCVPRKYYLSTLYTN